MSQQTPHMPDAGQPVRSLSWDGLVDLYDETRTFDQDCFRAAIAAIGARSTADVLAYCDSLGCRVEQVRDRWRWTARIPVARAIAYVAARAYSFTVSAPDAVHVAAIQALEREAAALPGGLEAVVEVPNQVYLAFVSRPARR